MAITPWLQAALAALPHITELVKSSKDLLKNNKSKKGEDPIVIDASDPQTMAMHLARVSSACENNSESIQILADQMHNQLQHSTQLVLSLNQRLRRTTTVAVIAIVIALLSAAKAFALF